jgi:thiol-disulfide isomerase/thioredoxin
MHRLFALLTCCPLLWGCGFYEASVDVPANPKPVAVETSAEGDPITVAPITSEATLESASTAASEVTLEILTFDEIQRLIASHKGKVVVIDCWSTSCEPCIKEFPNLVGLHRKFGAAKVACISFSFDYEGLDKPEEVRPSVLKFLKEQNATFDNVMSSEDSETLYKKLELASIPAVYVYDQEGKLAKRFDNEQIKKPPEAFTYNDVEALVVRLLGTQAD